MYTYSDKSSAPDLLYNLDASEMSLYLDKNLTTTHIQQKILIIHENTSSVT